MGLQQPRGRPREAHYCQGALSAAPRNLRPWNAAVPNRTAVLFAATLRALVRDESGSFSICGRFELAGYFRVSYRLNGSCSGLMDPELIPANSKRPQIRSGMKARTRCPKPIENGSINFRLGATRRKQVAAFGVGACGYHAFFQVGKKSRCDIRSAAKSPGHATRRSRTGPPF